MGLQINDNKIMVVTIKPVVMQHKKIGLYSLEQIENYKCLGVKLNYNFIYTTK